MNMQKISDPGGVPYATTLPPPAKHLSHATPFNALKRRLQEEVQTFSGHLILQAGPEDSVVHLLG